MEQIRQQAWQRFVVENIFFEQYDQLGIEVTESELIDMVQGVNINPQIRQIFADPTTGEFQKEGVISFLQQLNNAPSEQRLSWLAFEASLPEYRKLTKYENLINLTKFANKHEAKAAYQKNASLTVDYLYVPFFSLNDTLVTVTELELETYLKNNKNAYQREASRDAAYVIFPIEPSSEDSSFVRDEMQVIREGLIDNENDSSFAVLNSEGATPYGSYTPDNVPQWLDKSSLLTVGFVSEVKLVDNAYSVYKISDIRQGEEYFLKASHILFQSSDESAAAKSEARKEAQRVLNEIKRGADFGEMASIYGTDGTASRGGDLGWFGENSNYDEDFKKACFAKAGQGLISTVVETSFGYHLINITEAKTKTIYDISSIEKELFTYGPTDNAIYRQAEIFASESNNEKSFNENANSNGLEIRKATKVRKNDKLIGGVQNARSIVFWLFNEGADEKVSEVFELDGNYVVAIQTGEQEEGTAKLDEVINEVKRKVLDEKKAEQIIANLTKTEGSYEEISAAYGIGARTGTTELTLNSNNFPNVGLAPEAIGLAFALEEGESTRPFKTQNGIVMMSVTVKTLLEELADYEAYRSVVLNTQTDIRRREDPFTYQRIYDALVGAVEVVDNRYKFY